MKSYLKILVLSFFIFLACNSVQAASSDLIAVRIIPNPEHYSVERWYQVQGFSGQPQKTTVDGYEAIKDGRTVYVNAVYTSGTNLYTNIYIISYNQESEKVTADIMDKIISHWKFNNSLAATEEEATCSISGLSCQQDDDCGDYACTNNRCDSTKANPNSDTSCNSSNPCPSGYKCSNEKCIKDIKAVYCNNDSDCPNDFFCDSQKAKLVRNLKRLSAITEIREKLEEYNASHGRYPDLSAGTYIPQTSVSTWPSWSATFLSKINAGASLSDPINVLAKCKNDNAENSAFSPQTCWDEKTNRFADSDMADAALNLPLNSYAFIYEGSDDGAKFSLCANMESTTFAMAELKEIDCNDHSGNSIYGSIADNNEPQILEYSLLGEAGRPFSGFIRAYDPEGQAISWNINTSPGNPWTKWSSAPNLQNTSRATEKRLYSSTAGAPGEYPIIVTLTDSKGKASTQELKIVIKDNAPIIRAGNATYVANHLNAFEYVLYFEGENLKANVPIHTLEVEFGREGDFGSFGQGSNTLKYGLYKELKKISSGKYSLRIYTKTGGLAQYPVLNLSQPLDFKFKFSVIDDNNKTASADFVITIDPDRPILNFECPNNVRVNEQYSCLIAVDNWQGHTITYNITPANIFSAPAIADNENNSAHLTWRGKILAWWRSLFSQASAEGENGSIYNFQGKIREAKEYNVVVTATNEYNASSSKSFKLKADSYCGDGVRQGPNSERRGGIYDNGYELCDGSVGVATRPADSSPLRQYQCSYPSSTDKKPLETSSCYPNCCVPSGGFCGDGVCQVTKESNITTSTKFCKADCPTACEMTVECGYDYDCGYDVKCADRFERCEEVGEIDKCVVDVNALCSGRCGIIFYKTVEYNCGMTACNSNTDFCNLDGLCENKESYCEENGYCGDKVLSNGQTVPCSSSCEIGTCNPETNYCEEILCGRYGDSCNESFGQGRCCEGYECSEDSNKICRPIQSMCNCDGKVCGERNSCDTANCTACPSGKNCVNGRCVGSTDSSVF